MGRRKDSVQLSFEAPPSGHKKVLDFAKEIDLPLTDVLRSAVVEYMTTRGKLITLDELRFGEWGGARGEPKKEGTET
jgi:hypothetical protein